MRTLKNKIISFFIVLVSFFLCRSGFADIVQKEPYTILPKTGYKEDVNIAILPFSGELSEERKYIKDLVRNYLGNKILSYKKIRFDPSFINFKAAAFNSSNDGSKNKSTGSDDEGQQDERNNGRFLEIKLVEDKRLDAAKKAVTIESQGSVHVPGTDIIIAGVLIQNGNNIKIKLKLFNNIYAKLFAIEKEGSFKNIDQFIEGLSYEAIKAIIVHYSYLNISSNERDAAIYIDDRYFGRAAKSNILIESGIHKVVVSKENIAARTFRVNIAEKASESLRAEFTPGDIYAKHSIKITTLPEKAKVYLDSNFIGFSPVVKDDLLNGTYRIRIEKEGYISKYQTVEFGNDKDSRKDLSISLEKGDSKEYYFARTSAYNILFKCSFFGMAISSASYMYFGLKINDEDAKLRALSPADSDYNIKKNKIEERKDNYILYRQISLYSIGAMIISAGIFYYLDKAQDDIAIALYLPQKSYSEHSHIAFNASSSYSIDRGIGIIFTKSF